MYRIVRHSWTSRSEPRVHHDKCEPGFHPVGAVAGNSRELDCGDGDTPAMNGRGSSRHRAEAGSVAVEAGITISVLLLLIVGSVEFGRAFWTHNTMLLAVEEAGRYAMIHNRGSVVNCRAQSHDSQCPTFS